MIQPIRTVAEPLARQEQIAGARLRELRSPLAFLDEPASVPVLVDAAAGRVWTQDELADAVHVVAERMATDERELVFCLCDRTAASIIGYLGASARGPPRRPARCRRARSS